MEISRTNFLALFSCTELQIEIFLKYVTIEIFQALRYQFQAQQKTVNVVT